MLLAIKIYTYNKMKESVKKYKEIYKSVKNSKKL